MGKSSGAKQRVTEYYMSIHLGIATTVDAILEIMVGEKAAWTGTATSESAAYVNRASLFGGIKKEGGVKGYAYFLFGGLFQTVPNSLAARFGRTAANCPGFRGLTSIFFVGTFSPDDGWVPIPGGGGGGGGGSGGGWEDPGGGACPAPWVMITLASETHDGPGIEVRADALRPGMFVWTRHEDSLAWGAYEVEAAKIEHNQPRWVLDTEDGRRPVASPDHRVYTGRGDGWTQVQNLTGGDLIWGDKATRRVAARYFDHGDVVRISIKDARTYLMDGLLSHNLKPIEDL